MSEMKYGEIAYVDKPVSRILFGTASITSVPQQDRDALLDGIYALGVNAMDLARVYMGAEAVIGSWMEKRGNRDQLVLLSKCAHPNFLGMKRLNEKAIRKDFQKSSESLHTDHIDIYLLHRDDPKVRPGEMVEIFNAMHAEGKIGAFGASNWTHTRIAEANEYAYAHNLIPFTVSSPNYGLAEQIADPWGGGCVTVSGPSNKEAREWYAQSGMPVVAYSSLGRGFFSGRLKSGSGADEASKVLDKIAMKAYWCDSNMERLRRCEQLAAEKGCSVSQIAMAWIYAQSMNTYAVVSTSKPSRMQQNIDALSIQITPHEIRWLDLEEE
ncbi:MAG: aldo/keto reductase [Clostridia bacterium]|nr:aldo/keto reductase [Clostridia bacterium]